MILEIERGAGGVFSMWLFRLAGSIEHARPLRKLLGAPDYGSVSGEAKSIRRRACSCEAACLAQQMWSCGSISKSGQGTAICGFAGLFPKSLTRQKAA